MASLALDLSQLSPRIREAWEALVAEDPAGRCDYVQKYVRAIIFDAIERARISQNVFLSERNRQLLLDAARDEAAKHECLGALEVKMPPKRWFESAGLRGSTIAFVSNTAALLLLLFMRQGLVRDAVVAAFVVCGVLGSAVGWIGRRRATRRIA